MNRAIVAGAVGGALVVGGLLAVRVVKILKIVKNAEDAAAGDAAAQSAMALQARQLKANVEAHVQTVAEQTVMEYLGTYYGLTAERIEGLKRLAARLPV